MIWIVIGCIPIVLLIIGLIAMMAADFGIWAALRAFTFVAAITAIAAAASLSIGYGIGQL